MEDDALTLDTQETAQRELVYITNLENDLQNHGTKLNEEKGPKDKKPAVKKGFLKGPPWLVLITVPKYMKNLVVKMRMLKKKKRERMRRIQRNQNTLTLVAMRKESELSCGKSKNPRIITKSQEMKKK